MTDSAEDAGPWWLLPVCFLIASIMVIGGARGCENIKQERAACIDIMQEYVPEDKLKTALTLC